jgi:hypothetical protein
MPAIPAGAADDTVKQYCVAVLATLYITLRTHVPDGVSAVRMIVVGGEITSINTAKAMVKLSTPVHARVIEYTPTVGNVKVFSSVANGKLAE